MTDKLRREDFEKEQQVVDAQGRDLAAARAKLATVTKERDRLMTQLNLIEEAGATKVKRPAWMMPTEKKGVVHNATLCLLITDTHFDEEVNADEVDGINAYNREIAELRLRHCFERTVHLARKYLSGLKYDGVCLMLGGDIFSGNIHQELERTNRDTLFGSLLHWIGPMSAGVTMLADEFGKVHVAGVPGNHGRMTRKPIAKQRSADNLDWLLYRLMQRDLHSDRRVTWEIAQAADAHVQVYNTRFLLTHGDQFRGGSGISGALAPLMLGSHRKTRRQSAAGRPYDCMVMGHWHQNIYLPSRGLIVGGCLKGYDEFAYVSNFEPEPAQQSLWVTTPEHGITFSAPVFVQNREAEGW
jgi:predicted phosphodiesterase